MNISLNGDKTNSLYILIYIFLTAYNKLLITRAFHHKTVRDFIDFIKERLSHSPTVYSDNPIYTATNIPMMLAINMCRRNIMKVATQSPKYVP